MLKSMAFFLVLFSCQCGDAQEMIVLKKRQKSIQHFWTGSHLTFQQRDGQWLSGIITRITPDSFYFKREIIRYSFMGSDTFHLDVQRFALTDVRALPTKKQLTYYDRDQVRVILGHEKLVWVRNGFIFQAAGAGYLGLNIANDLIHNDPPFAKSKLPRLGIAAGVFLLGQLLHRTFDPYLHTGKKYRLQTIFLRKEATPSSSNTPHL